MPDIHSSAVIEHGAEIAETAKVGPFCTVGAHVVIGEGTVLHSHVAIAGRTRLGANNKVFPFVSLGHPPQDLKYRGEPSELVIGDNNTIRETATMNPGTEGGGMLTEVGSGGLFMAGAHVGHDCRVGDHVVFANNATVAGHCVVEDHAILGGLSAVHQFVRIGAHAFLGGMSGLEYDLIPFGTAVGDRARLQGLNLIGLRRRGFNKEQFHSLRKAYRMLFTDEGTLAERVADVDEEFGVDEGVRQILDFVKADSHRSLCLPREPETI